MRVEEGEDGVVLTPVLGKVSLNQTPVGALAGRTVGSLSAEEKMELCHRFFLTGNLSELARERNVSYVELRGLAEEAWWGEELARLRRETTAIARAKITGILGQTITQLEERLRDGDPHVAFGQVTFAPVKASDLAKIATTLFLKEKELVEEEGRREKERGKLTLIAQALREKVGMTIVEEKGDGDGQSGDIGESGGEGVTGEGIVAGGNEGRLQTRDRGSGE